jgi:protein-disulfide isomerase
VGLQYGFTSVIHFSEAALNRISDLARHKTFVASALVALIFLFGGLRGAAAQDQVAPATKSTTATASKPSSASTGKTSTKKAGKSVAKPAAEEPVGPPNKGVGFPSAPIVMEVYSDYMCPQCRNFYMGTLKAMMNDYVPAGKVYLIHRDFPLPIAQHKYNWDAARWGTAAARIGRFEEVDRALYDNEPTWEADGNIQKIVAATLSPADFRRVQKMVAPCLSQTPPELRPTVPTGATCSLDTFIQQDIALGKQVPVQSTPTYVITNKGSRIPPGSGFVSWPLLKQFLDSLGQ